MVITAPQVLVVDDDPTVAEVVSRYLQKAGYAVTCCADGLSALAAAARNPPDLVVLDLMLPGIDGLEVCRRLRAIAPIPVIMLTARGEETDRIAGLEIGADDYVTKPFSPRELTLRVQSVLRRAAGPLDAGGDSAVLVSADLRVDPAARDARLAGVPVSLTLREFELLAFFMRHPRQAFTREQLLDKVWGYTFGDHSTVTVHVRRLREKIEPDPAEPVRIRTVWGVGYRWEPAPADVAAAAAEDPQR
ncbi:MAG: response regulator transcription factor [Actinomycetota bacterium]